MEQIFNGYVWSDLQDGLLGVAIHRAGQIAATGERLFDVYYGDGESDDQLYTVQEFIRRFGLKLYNTVEDFKRGNSISADRVMV